MTNALSFFLILALSVAFAASTVICIFDAHGMFAVVFGVIAVLSLFGVRAIAHSTTRKT